MLFTLYGLIRGDIRLGICVGISISALFELYGRRERLTAGSDWLAFRRIIGTKWVDLNNLSKDQVVVNTQGLNFEFKETAKRRVYLKSDFALADPDIKKIITKAISRARKNGADVDSRASSLLK